MQKRYPSELVQIARVHSKRELWKTCEFCLLQSAFAIISSLILVRACKASVRAVILLTKFVFGYLEVQFTACVLWRENE